MEKWMIFYGITILATMAGDVAVTLRANDIRKEKGMKEISYMPPILDILTYCIPIYNLIIFASYGIALFFATDEEFLDAMGNEAN